ncbi:hypothetical protein [Streptomyces leeuwenhoekii]|uniref:Sle1_041 protein n=1 Tax=Streptomyces leeuwenhoekii TaxID=1437453 RepID=A0A0F7VMC8_STRLW|nr:hypothetical protein [Streptomyces leeuwenhoekii]CQR59208.1 sle1_041 [Streptomyces leeuwenhoekii]
MPHTPDWHALEETNERVWLDQWARGAIDPHSLRPHRPAPAPEPALTGSTR